MFPFFICTVNIFVRFPSSIRTQSCQTLLIPKKRKHGLKWTETAMVCAESLQISPPSNRRRRPQRIPTSRMIRAKLPCTRRFSESLEKGEMVYYWRVLDMDTKILLDILQEFDWWKKKILSLPKQFFLVWSRGRSPNPKKRRRDGSRLPGFFPAFFKGCQPQSCPEKGIGKNEIIPLLKVVGWLFLSKKRWCFLSIPSGIESRK